MTTHDQATSQVPGSVPSFLAPTAPAPAGGVDVTVVVVNYNTEALLLPMRAALLASVGSLSVELIVIDNASRDASLAVLEREFRDARAIVGQANLGFGRANNLALPHARGRYLLLLNTDAFISPSTLASTVACMDAHPEFGILGARLVGRDGRLQPSCRHFPTPWNVFLHRTGLKRFFPHQRMVDDMSWDHRSNRECDWVPGCYYLVRRELIEQIGLFDPRFFLYYEEVDHCRMAKSAGWKVVFFAGAEVVHLGGESAKSDGDLTAAGKQLSALQVESELLYFRKHFGLNGVLIAVLLNHLTDLLSFVKALMRRRSLAELRPQRDGLRQYWRLIRKTRCGLRPTR